MTKIRLVTDSTADIPVEIRQQWGIEMVPLKVHFGSKTYLDSVTLQSEPFYRMLKESRELPTTSQPSPVDFLNMFKQLTADPDTEVLAILISSRFSGTYQSAVLAKSMMEEQGDRVTIIDSLSATYGIGLLAVAAAEAARQGKTMQEIVEIVDRLRQDTTIYFLVDTLEYLQKGGRIGKASYLLGSLLNIKPILSVDDDGEVTAVDKVRGQKRAMGRIIEMLKEKYGSDAVRLTVAHAQALESAEEFSSAIRQELNVVESSYTEIGPVIGAHVGGGTVGALVRRV